jgi:hypothetical protein
MLNLEYTLTKPLDLVYDYLSDMQKFVSVHPIIYKIDPLGNDRYLVFEKLKVLFIPYSFTYVVTLLKNEKENKITISATVKKMVHIKMEFVLENVNESTKISECVEFRSFLPVKPIMRKIFREQHKVLFENIGKVSST